MLDSIHNDREQSPTKGLHRILGELRLCAGSARLKNVRAGNRLTFCRPSKATRVGKAWEDQLNFALDPNVAHDIWEFGAVSLMYT